MRRSEIISQDWIAKLENAIIFILHKNYMWNELAWVARWVCMGEMDVIKYETGKAQRVVVVGAGFGGLEVVKGLAGRGGFEVVWLDRTNHHLFQPLLYQVACAVLSAPDIAIPARSLAGKFANVSVRMEEVEGVDWENNILMATGRNGTQETIPFDYLVMATGARPGYFGHDEWRRHTLSLKSVPDALEIRRRWLTAFEQAEIAPDVDAAARCLRFVVVGGGPTGVEVAGAMAELGAMVVKRDFHRIDPKSMRITLVEAGPRLLPSFSPELGEYARKSLMRRGVDVRTGSAVMDVDENGVTLADGRIDSGLVVWAAGVKGAPIMEKMDLALDPQKRVLVEPDCRAQGRDNVFVIGDAAHFRHGTERPLPGVSPVAMQQGRYVARWLRRHASGLTSPPFVYRDKGSMAIIGRGDAVAEVGGFKLTGFVAWLAWLFVHLVYLVGFKNKVSALVSWIWSFAMAGGGARMIAEPVNANKTPASQAAER